MQMGESACLLRSFSHPTESSSEVIEGDPIRALGESISFGRYMSESLAWEKWSAFSHNRYLEEAEKFSKPGSVAAKKAYFEAHYKKKAAEKAAALLQEANGSANQVTDVETKDENQNNSSMEIKSKSDSPFYEEMEKDSLNAEVIDYSNENRNNCGTERNGDDINVEREEAVQQCGIDANLNLENCEVIDYLNENRNGCGTERNGDDINLEREEAVQKFGIDANLNLENCSSVNNVNQLDNVEDHGKIFIPDEETEANKEAAGQEILTLPTEEVVTSPSKSLSGSKAPKLSSSLGQGTALTKVDSVTSHSKWLSGNKAPKPSSSLGQGTTSTRSTNGINGAPKIFEQSGNKRINASLLNLSKDCPVATRTITRASVNGLSKQPSVKPPSEGRRTKTLLTKSVSGGVIADAKVSSLSSDCFRSSNATGSKGRSPIVSSPFIFKSEERAAKRKERLEEKNKSKEAEKLQLQASSKEKAEHDHKKLRQSNGFKPKVNEDMSRGIQSPNNYIKKVSLARPQSPKVGRKPTYSTVQNTSSRRSWMPPVSKSSKQATEKSNQFTRSTSHSVTTLSKKSARENASPNIQH
ncbi:protein WVD2-like 7 isoform X1 [Quillaja saponaria]|uniref:Protein WVD2-like 7 isoform X1 n=1 Tax=Quillaja saponaria TaxID=32244 RepID=A0AAD7KTG0_QUISA|nr:protein WVD2-like 7 isoform X1 [Quillaja saponaria]